MRPTPENKGITRDNVQKMINDKMSPQGIKNALRSLKASDEEIQKILSDLSSYR